MKNFNDDIGANPGRSGHRLSIDAGRVIFDTREAISKLFNINDPLQIIFTKNATEALNIAILGLLQPGDHVITTSMEHNSVMRPLRYLEKNDVELSVVQCAVNGGMDPHAIIPLIKKNTRALIITHASNVTGTIMPIAEIGAMAREKNIILCADAAQTAGALTIDVEKMNVDVLAFTGHKSLFGPQGTGGLYIRKGLDAEIRPIMTGGTGSRSEFEEQPDFMPDKFESGTPNSIGLAGLGAGVNFILSAGIDVIRRKEEELTGRFLEGLKSLKGVTCYGPAEKEMRTSVVSFNIKGMTPSDVSFELDEKYGIMSRPGLHCAPSAHRTIGTFSQGTVRFSFGNFNTGKEIDFALEAIDAIAMKI
jgi:cysteine desulfurase family protein